jgi:hypothetical protein
MDGLDLMKQNEVRADNTFRKLFSGSQKGAKGFANYAAMRGFLDKMAPPQGERKQFSKAISPDWIVAAALIASVFFLYQIYIQQPSAFLPALVGALILIAVYVLTRKSILKKYLNRLDGQAKDKKTIEKAIEIWMKLYFCPTSYSVFLPGHKEVIPLEEMNSFLLDRAKGNLHKN